MKQRLITSAIALSLLFICFYFYHTFIFNVLVLLFSVIGVYEALTAMKCTDNKLITAACLLLSAAVPCMSYSFFVKWSYLFFWGLAVFIIFVWVFNYSKVDISKTTFAFFAAVCFPTALSTVLFLRDTVDAHSFVYLILGFGGAFITDSGAYFAGHFFGKHKMAPVLSPNKTWEGVVGGVASTLIFFFAFLYIYRIFNPIEIRAFVVIIYAIVSAFLAIVGDLGASALKRKVGIKDYGNLFPGQGGVLDRCDSLMLVMPVIFVLSVFLPIIV